MEILIGCDPEVFVRNEHGFISAHNMIPGTKKDPHKVKDGAVQVDGLALEFNIDPAHTEEEFVTRVESVMNILKEMAGNVELVATPSADFNAEYMKTLPKEALELGCDPDFNAWDDGAPNPKPDGNVNFRTGSGHIHIGWTEGADINDPEHLEACIMAAKQLDFYVGLGSKMFDKDDRRAQLYGDWGCFRPKPYGMEYRTLSNAWLTKKEYMKWVYKNAKLAIENLIKGDYILNSGYSKYHLNYYTNIIRRNQSFHYYDSSISKLMPKV